MTTEMPKHRVFEWRGDIHNPHLELLLNEGWYIINATAQHACSTRSGPIVYVLRHDWTSPRPPKEQDG